MRHSRSMPELIRLAMIRTYSEMKKLNSFEERFEYLKLSGNVGDDTFGFDRYLNQRFYNSKLWKKVRDEIIVRDNGCEFGIDSEPIYGNIIIHHMNPIRIDDVLNVTEYLTNPEYLVCVSDKTHKALHYSKLDKASRKPIQRSKNDTCPWKNI